VLAVLLVVAVALQATPRERIPHFADRTPNVIAHAGAQGHAPGNTMAAFDRALELGADTLEMDLQLSADGEVVVIHDGTVDRTTDGTGAVAALTLAELETLDAGYAFSPDDGATHPYRGQGVRIPTLDAVLAAYPDTYLIIELKTDGGRAIVDAVVDRLRAAGRTHDVLVASFDRSYLEAFRARMPEVPTSLAEDEVRRFYPLHLAGLHRWWRAPGAAFHVPEWSGDTHVVRPRFVRAAADLGLDVQVWTVNEPEDMHRLLDVGVQGIMTDYPDRLVAVIAEREAAGLVHRLGVVEPYGVAASRFLQERAEWLTPVAAFVTHLGDEDFYVLVFPLLYWSVSAALGIRMGVLLLLSAALGAALKLAFRSPRPYFFDPAVGRLTETSLGIPSGHAQNAVAVWGLLAAAARRPAVRVAAVGVILAIAYSRVHLGVHLPIDIVTGWLAGLALLVAFLRFEDPVTGWLARRRPRDQVAAAFAASLGLIALGALARLGLDGFTAPVGWIGAGDLTEATGLSGVVTPAAALFGLAVGIVGLQRQGGYSSDGPVWQRVLRYPLGLVGVVVLWLGLGAVLPGGEEPLALVLRYVRYALVGAWIAGGAPWLFLRLRLATAPPAFRTLPARAS
jgi:glycerophosphoryl diester phosphodiesterase/membrane-associated phospholipid phosphatase